MNPNPASERLLFKGLKWYNGSVRNFFGPTPGSLVPLNLLAAMFTHAHSDVSMRILHGYTSMGLIPGLLASLYLMRRNVLLGSPLVLMVLNVSTVTLNTQIAVAGMNIPYGAYFHILIAILLVINFLTIERLKQHRPPSPL